MPVQQPVQPPLGRDTVPQALARDTADTARIAGIGDTARFADRPDTLAFELDDEALATMWAPRGLKIFGRDLFTRATSQFQAVNAGPVDPSYRLGPGDQILLVLTGDVELAHTLEVTREGTIVVPQVGQIVVQDLTMREVEDQIHERLSRVFSGVGRGPGATTQFSASLGRIRSNQVFLAGEVERPGAYQVSSIGTAFSALYQARGPNPHGSFRSVQVRRGGEPVRTIDIYNYLLRGDSRQDIRLEQGDIVFVPLAGRQVAIQGAVRRGAIYELREGEGLRELLGFAGGLEAAASISRIQIDRILPPEQREPGRERVLIDVDLTALSRGTPVQMHDRDVVRVFAVSEERRNRVVVEGEVRKPGVYEWSPGARLWDVIQRAEGLTPYAYTPRAHIYRLNVQDGTRFLVSAPLLGDSASGQRLANVDLADADSIIVYSLADLRNPRMVTIRGLVKRPGIFALAEGMTVGDLVLAAGGFAEGADQTGVELIRAIESPVRTDSLARLQRIPLGNGNGAAPGNGGTSVLESSTWIGVGQDVALADRDQVIVRRSPGYEEPRMVMVSGHVAAPGPYPLETRRVDLVEIIRRAGGITSEGDPNGVRVTRDSVPVATSYVAAARRPRSRHNIVLQHGDQIHVPAADPTVRVEGAVAFSARVLHVPGHTTEDYIANAGGYTRFADRSRVSVTYPDGRRAIVRRSLFGRTSPPVTPGSVITVPSQPEPQATNWGDVITRTVSILGSILTMIVAVDRISR